MKTAFLIGLAFAGLVSSTAMAQAPAAPPPAPGQRAFGDWTVRCGGPAQTPCEMVYGVVQKESGQQVLVVSLVYLPAREAQVMQIGVPLGVSIPKGLLMKSSAFTSGKLDFQRCDRNGCFVVMQINQETLDAFNSADPKGTITVYGDNDGKDVNLSMSFNGFAAANAYLIEQARARSKGAAPPAAPTVIDGQ